MQTLDACLDADGEVGLDGGLLGELDRHARGPPPVNHGRRVDSTTDDHRHGVRASSLAALRRRRNAVVDELTQHPVVQPPSVPRDWKK